ncbi:MAG: glycosyltransferase family 2 protein [Candidatus Binatus sp.]|uniref:glycosyltransferase family 2 protein n=1 Tax=Candidatus Binatus sp. TaxID=2811406 RepID=UPI003BAF9CA3
MKQESTALPLTKQEPNYHEPSAPDLARTRPRLAIVVPCFNEELVIGETVRRLAAVLRDLRERGQVAHDSFLFFVDDGSADKTWGLLLDLNQSNPEVKGLKLARNFGHQNAVLAGLLTVRHRADCVISMDADLQHDEQAIYDFLGKYRDGADIVYGVRRDAGNVPLSKKVGSSLFYWLMTSMGAKVVKGHPDYRLVSARVLDTLADYKEVNVFLRGIFANMGFRSEVVYFDVHDRAAGTTHYSWRKMIALALDGVTSFSVVPLRIIAIGGVLITLGALAVAVFIIFSAIRGDVVPGWASTVLPIYVLGGIQIMTLGLVAEYIGKIYSEVKQRPRFITEQELS